MSVVWQSWVMKAEGLHLLVDSGSRTVILLPYISAEVVLPSARMIILITVSEIKLTRRGSEGWLLSVSFEYAESIEVKDSQGGGATVIPGDLTEVDDEGGMSEFQHSGYEWP